MPEVATTNGQPAATTPGVFVDPFRAYNFKLEIMGVTQGHFTECSGLGIDIEPIRYREGGSSQVVHCVPGQVTYGEVTLRYGLTASSELWQWVMSAVQGQVRRLNVSVLLLDSTGATEVLRWNLMNAWPRSWRGAPLDALGQEVAIESLSIVFEGLERA